MSTLTWPSLAFMAGTVEQWLVVFSPDSNLKVGCSLPVVSLKFACYLCACMGFLHQPKYSLVGLTGYSKWTIDVKYIMCCMVKM